MSKSIITVKLHLTDNVVVDTNINYDDDGDILYCGSVNPDATPAKTSDEESYSFFANGFSGINMSELTKQSFEEENADEIEHEAAIGLASIKRNLFGDINNKRLLTETLNEAKQAQADLRQDCIRLNDNLQDVKRITDKSIKRCRLMLDDLLEQQALINSLTIDIMDVTDKV
jgi:hypothetical protein